MKQKKNYIFRIGSALYQKDRLIERNEDKLKEEQIDRQFIDGQIDRERKKNIGRDFKIERQKLEQNGQRNTD